MDGWTDGLAVELPIKFKFFTKCYGSKNLYFWEQKNDPLAHISLCIRAVTRAVSHLIRDSLFIAQCNFAMHRGENIIILLVKHYLKISTIEFSLGNLVLLSFRERFKYISHDRHHFRYGCSIACGTVGDESKKKKKNIERESLFNLSAADT